MLLQKQNGIFIFCQQESKGNIVIRQTQGQKYDSVTKNISNFIDKNIIDDKLKD